MLLDVSRAAVGRRGPDVRIGAPPGTWRPDPAAYAAFARALATRYSGHYRLAGRLARAAGPALPAGPLLPGVERAEPLRPIWRRSRRRAEAASVEVYRGAAQRLLRPGEGGQSPTTSSSPRGTGPFGDDLGGERIRPLEFWRQLLCVDAAKPAACDPCPVPATVRRPRAPPDQHGRRPARPRRPPGRCHDPGHRGAAPPAARRRARSAPSPARRIQLWVTELWWETRPARPERDLAGAAGALDGRVALRALAARGRRRLLPRASPTPLTRASRAAPSCRAGSSSPTATPKPSFTAYRFPLVTAEAGQARGAASGRSRRRRARCGSSAARTAGGSTRRERGGRRRQDPPRHARAAAGRSAYRALVGGEAQPPLQVRGADRSSSTYRSALSASVRNSADEMARLSRGIRRLHA